LHGFANSAFLSDFLFPVLPTVAGYCVRVRVKLGSTTAAYDRLLSPTIPLTAEDYDRHRSFSDDPELPVQVRRRIVVGAPTCAA
jgi:hypothetical protein